MSKPEMPARLGARVTDQQLVEIRRRALFWSFLEDGAWPPSVSAYLRHVALTRPLPERGHPGELDPELVEQLRRAGRRLNGITRSLNAGNLQVFAASAEDVLADVDAQLEQALGEVCRSAAAHLVDVADSPADLPAGLRELVLEFLARYR